MPDTAPIALPRLVCRPLPAFAPDRLETVRAAFGPADGCVLGQAWLASPEPDFTPARVRVGWRADRLLVFAELDDADIYTRADAPNQQTWELGDVLEMFLSPADAPGYVEFHVTPNNLRLQLRLPDTPALRRAQAANAFADLILPDGVFCSRAWTEPDNRKWFVYAEIPALAVVGAVRPLVGSRWRFSFSRYDYVRGRSEPLISSSSPHAQPDFHRRQEWGTMVFV